VRVANLLTCHEHDKMPFLSRQFSGAATFEFRRDGEAWLVLGHFFDDIGRSVQISLKAEVGWPQKYDSDRPRAFEVWNARA
jgi:hypothetical protein